ncbi:hypothetical protein ACFS5J_04110 [Flavobacterium chuncheonense]|uniref:Uncharacterized protein n=1 Tax=Flavobacterium chuncheonense TaxID=2026653 RepID=A0ABW5YJE7_9FLAO
MENNLLMWIQNEANGEFDYMFYGSQLLMKSDLQKVKIVREMVFNNPNAKTIWKDKNYSQSSVLKINSNYIITGVLKSEDCNNRKLPFMFYLPSSMEKIEDNIYLNLKLIDKEIDEELLNQLLSKANSNDVFIKFTFITNYKKKVILSSILMLILILLYKIFYSK